MKIEATPITSLEEISTNAAAEVSENFNLNYIASYLISAANLIDNPLRDVTEEAQRWDAPQKPIELQFNHGQYIKDGLDHIITELRHKKTSNRALFSLLAQESISSTGDTPIPSFMLMQCNIHENILYCTSYFRALEVTKFLRINLEELRLRISKIYDSVPEFDRVVITIFAFRAYKKQDINTLAIPEIDRLNVLQIYIGLKDCPKNIAGMIKEKSHPSSVIDIESMRRLIEAVNQLKKDNHANFNTVLINKNANHAIYIAEKLSEFRKISSHHPEIERYNKEFQNALDSIAKELVR